MVVTRRHNQPITVARLAEAGHGRKEEKVMANTATHTQKTHSEPLSQPEASLSLAGLADTRGGFLETLTRRAHEIEDDPLSAACEAVLALKALLETLRTLRGGEVENARTDPVMRLSDLAEEQNELIEGCSGLMLQEIEEGRMPGRPGAPGQYKPIKAASRKDA
jgi:hypothetical protein